MAVVNGLTWPEAWHVMPDEEDAPGICHVLSFNVSATPLTRLPNARYVT